MSGISKKLMGTTAAGGEALAIEDVFSTYLFDSSYSVSPVTVTNGIDLAGEGGMVWVKSRTDAGTENNISDTERGTGNKLITNGTYANIVNPYENCSAFNSDGFAYNDGFGASTNKASWTFRKAPRFFDVVTYTGDGTDGRQITHSLGQSVGACIIKRTDSTGDWPVWHRSGGYNGSSHLHGVLNYTDAFANYGYFNTSLDQSTYFTSTYFTVQSQSSVNASGGTYIAYLFAHDPLGPSEDGSDGLIACGSYTGNGSTDGPEIDLGWEPQWLLVKQTSTSGDDWYVVDSMRGFNVSGTTAHLSPNTSAQEFTTDAIEPRATGFKLVKSYGAWNSSGSNYIYIAIRRGPMRAPTSGTEVFDVVSQTPNANLTGTKVTSQAGVVDAVITTQRSHSGLPSTAVVDRMRGGNIHLATNSTAADNVRPTYFWYLDHNDGLIDNYAYPSGSVTTDMIYWLFRRAPGFFDVVAYSGNSSTNTLNHNLGVAPEMIVYKARNGALPWRVHANITSGGYDRLVLDSSAAKIDTEAYGSTKELASQPTATQLVLGNGSGTNNSSSYNYIAYLFASLPGISKVGSFTISGSDITVDCGFSSGARFVLIKRSSGTDDWYVFDTVRGYVSGSGDAALKLNSTAAESSLNMIEPHASGFSLRAAAWYNGDYIFYAIA